MVSSVLEMAACRCMLALLALRLRAIGRPGPRGNERGTRQQRRSRAHLTDGGVSLLLQSAPVCNPEPRPSCSHDGAICKQTVQHHDFIGARHAVMWQNMAVW
jgi:hypothetical protein